MEILGPNAGQEQPTRDSATIIKRMRQEVIKAKQLTDRPFGMVVVVTMDAKDTMSLIKVVVDEHVAAVLINGVPGVLNKELIEPLKEHDIKIIYRSLNPTVSEAKEAEQAGADIIIATGFDEGGTVPEKVIGTFNIVPTISDAVQIPVVAAGGITDIRHVRAAFALGAEGVYVGSAFLATEESRAAETSKQQSLMARLMIWNSLGPFRTTTVHCQSS
ncbi:nitronate monooxygenase [Limosilactobacillus sp.]|uniref:nitronate monooxygenase n=1 Tax=Limosilactobacillus sp. TaxID=2773925 RepID=UPI003F11CAB3